MLTPAEGVSSPGAVTPGSEHHPFGGGGRPGNGVSHTYAVPAASRGCDSAPRGRGPACEVVSAGAPALCDAWASSGEGVLLRAPAVRALAVDEWNEWTVVRAPAAPLEWRAPPAMPTGRLQCQGLHLLGRRVDAFYVAFQGRVSEETKTVLRAAHTRAVMTRTDVAHELAPGVEFTLSQRSHDGAWVLSTDEMHLRVLEGASGEWNAEVTPRALLLGRKGIREVYDHCRGVAACVLDAITGARVRRIDLASDWQAFGLADVAPDAWLLPSWRSSVRAIATVSEFRRRRIRTGFVIGKADAMLRVYDKTEELNLPENAGDKRGEEHARWKASGWNGSQVVRVEFQARGAVLKELKGADGEALRDDPLALIAQLDSVWAYFTREWTRLVVPGSATRHERCKVDPRWEAVQAVTFRELAEPAPRVRAPTRPERWTAPLRMMTAEAVDGSVDAHTLDKRDVRERWASQDEAREYVERRMIGSVLDRAFRRGQHEALDVLVRRFRGSYVEVAAYLIERQRAGLARGRALDREAWERAAIIMAEGKVRAA